MNRPVATDPGAALVLAALAFIGGIIVGVVVGAGRRAVSPALHCTSTVRVEPSAPGEWTLTCGGAR